MFISLAGDGAQFTNKLFNTIEIKPKSYICLNTFSIKKNEVITLEDDSSAFFYADYNNIYDIFIPKGTYDIYSLCETFNQYGENVMSKYSVRAKVETNLGENKIRIYCDNKPVPELDFGIFHDLTDNPALNNYNIQWGGMLQNGDRPRDISGNATWKNVGMSSPNHSYCIIKSKQPLGTADQNQTTGVMPYILSGSPAYVAPDGSGTPGINYDSQEAISTGINQSCAQASYQKYDDNDMPPTQDNGNDTAGGSVYYKTADLLRNEGAIIFVAGSQGSTKDFVILNGNEEKGRSPDPVPQDLSNFTTGNNTGCKIWLHWEDPRDIENFNRIKIGYNKLDIDTGNTEWVVADVRTDDRLEERFACEGCKFTTTFEAQNGNPNWTSLYHPLITCDSINLIQNQLFTHIIAFWDMDIPFVTTPGAEDIFYDSDGNVIQGQFKLNNPSHCAYEYLYSNVGEYSYDGAKASGHYWGTEFNTQESFRADGYFKGSGFELRSGQGSIDWTQSGSLNNTPGLYGTAFGVSRTTLSGAGGYKNAFYKFPDMYGGKSERDYKGLSETTPSGTILPASMPVTTIGTYYLNLSFRLDNSAETKYQIIYAYEGDDKATGVATDPFTMLGVKIGSDKLVCANGKPNAADREEISIVDAAGAPFTFTHSTWYSITLAFQSASGGNVSPWLVCGVQENGGTFHGKATTVSGHPTRALFGLGGNDKCNGSQTVSSGLIGVVKLFKIGFFSGNIADNTDYVIDDIIKVTCADHYEDNGDLNYWSRQKLIESQVIVSDDPLTDAMEGFGNPTFDKDLFLTCCLGQSPQGTPAKASCYNPYDTLFTAPIWRQNFQPNLEYRLVDNAGATIQKYLPGGQYQVSRPDVGFILNDPDSYGSTPNDIIIIAMGFPKLQNQVYQLVAQQPQGQAELGYNDADNEVDTEVGLNDNRFHIDNLPIQSYNGVVGSMDRAIYQSQAVLSTRKTGANFVNNSFTIPQKIWIPLNNAGNIHMNEFNVKITDIEDVLDEEVISSQMTIEIKDEKEMLISK